MPYCIDILLLIISSRGFPLGDYLTNMKFDLLENIFVTGHTFSMFLLASLFYIYILDGICILS